MDTIINAVARVRAATIEQACEAALAGGRCGVLVNDDLGTAEPNAAVRYGTIECIPWQGGPGWGQPQDYVLAY